MNKNYKKNYLSLIAALILVLSLSGCGQAISQMPASIQSQADSSRAIPIWTEISQEGSIQAENSQEASIRYDSPSPIVTSTTTEVSLPLETLPAIDEAGRYNTPEDVAAYLHLYNQLPSNFITKQEAIDLGWESERGNLWDVTDKFSIGGDVFGNREGLLPKKSGRVWYECDVNYNGGFRGAERVVYSSDGLVFYTKDHYETFSQLY